jgi:ubiquinol-cytochrome c reductase cytochrome b subunit
VFVFFMADSLGDPANYIPANPLQTPPEIVPEWYLLPFYAVLRAFDFNIGPIDSKVAGVLAMFASIGVLFVLPWLDTSKVRSMRYRPIARQFFLIFVVVCIALGWCGGQNPGRILFKSAEYSATLEWIEGGAVVEDDFTAASEDAFAQSSAAMGASLAGADGMAMVSRQSATAAHLMAVTGGARQSRSVSAATIEELEAHVQEVKVEVGARAPFFMTTRQMPLTFTVTTFSQILTFYYFFFFLGLLPLLGLLEKPGLVPNTIAKPVLAGGAS